MTLRNPKINAVGRSADESPAWYKSVACDKSADRPVVFVPLVPMV